jgi:alpha-D-xyloside xylohydrolase
MNTFEEKNNCLVWSFNSEKLVIEPWGNNSFRVRATKNFRFIENNWALLPKQNSTNAIIKIENDKATIINNKIKAIVTSKGRISFYDKSDKLLLREFRRIWDDELNASALNINGRELIPIPGGDYKIDMKFEASLNEKIFGMGQYQQPFLNLKNCTLELAHRNSQASVPFYISNLGYGFLWNNPAIGEVQFSQNITKWTADSTKELDYWITCGDSPSEIEESYAKVTGTVPMMPEYGLGLWQSKLRYQTQEEVLEVAREYKKRNIDLSVIVVDFFHWTIEGTWDFDEKYWPEPEKMVKELKDMGIELMVSIWPTIDIKSENYKEMLSKGYLVNTDRGIKVNMQFMGDTVYYDPTNPDARKYLWETVKSNYYNKGIKVFWLDEAEPEFTYYDFDNYRYYLGSSLQVGNIYPLMYAKTFFDGRKDEGEKDILNLVRCVWAGSQRYGVLAWSGDVYSSFESFRNQIRAGLNMAIAGIPWWTTDIGGFFGGNINDNKFKELIIRWFQYGVFCPVFRMHGDREPHSKPIGTEGGGVFHSGAPNEIWSYGENVYEIFKKFINVRENLKPYIKELMAKAHEKGTPPMRPLFYDFDEDENSWDIDDEFLLGEDILVAPVMYENSKEREVYLPKGSRWVSINTKESFDGNQIIKVKTPIEEIPVFIREASKLIKIDLFKDNR